LSDAWYCFFDWLLFTALFLLSRAFEVKDLALDLSFDFWALLTALTAARVVAAAEQLPKELASLRSVRVSCVLAAAGGLGVGVASIDPDSLGVLEDPVEPPGGTWVLSLRDPRVRWVGRSSTTTQSSSPSERAGLVAGGVEATGLLEGLVSVSSLLLAPKM